MTWDLPPAINGTHHDNDRSPPGKQRSPALRKNGKDLRIYFHNVSGISSSSHLAAIRAAVATCHYDVIVFIETWFTTEIKSSEIFDEREWLVIRCDRCDTGDNRRGGGVLIAIRLTLTAARLELIMR